MQRVRLLGELGELFGSEFVYNKLRRPADAIKVLCINRPAFKDYLLKSEENGVAFQIIQGGVDMGVEDLVLPFGSKELVIAPVIMGSGGFFQSPVGRIVTGAALIGVSFLLPGAGIFGTTGLGGTLAAGSTAAVPFVGAAGVAGSAFGTALGTALSVIGAGLVLGGVSEIISPQPQVPSFGAQAGFGTNNRTAGPQRVSRDFDGQSYAYLGAANTVGMGATVPVAYGKVLIGSHLLRSRLEVSDESQPVLSAIKKPGPLTMRMGGEKFRVKFRTVSGAVVRKMEPFRTKYGSDAVIDEVNITTDNILVLNDADPRPEGNTAKNRVQASITRDTANRQKFNVAFSIENGLFNKVGDTKVDAYITYRIDVFRGNSTSSSRLIASETATIQGLLNKSDNFAYMHKLNLPKIYDPDFTQTVEVKIIDSDADQGQQLKLTCIGYNLTPLPS